MRTIGLGLALVALLSACGNTNTERMLTGGATGATAGAVVGGPLGFVVGGLGGAAGGAMMDQSATDYVNLTFMDDEIAEARDEVEEVTE